MSWKIRTTVLWVKIGVVFLISSDAAPSSCIQPLYADTSDILPRCELLHKLRYDQELISSWWGRKLKINSRTENSERLIRQYDIL